MTKNMNKAQLIERIATLELALVEDRTCFQAAIKMMEEERDAWKTKATELATELQVLENTTGVHVVMDQEKIDASAKKIDWNGVERRGVKEVVEANIIKVEANKVAACMAWAIKKVNFPYVVHADFMANYVVEVSKDQGWMRMRPAKATAATVAFAKDFLQFCREKNLKANYWKNDGVYFYY